MTMDAPDPHEKFTQILAVLVIFIGAVATGIGDFWHLTTLANSGGTIVGGGIGILTAQKMQQITTKGGGSINNPPPPE